jgi:hypothetical protein
MKIERYSSVSKNYSEGAFEDTQRGDRLRIRRTKKECWEMTPELRSCFPAIPYEDVKPRHDCPAGSVSDWGVD